MSMKPIMKLNVGDNLYAVTDQHVVIPLVVTVSEPHDKVEGITVINTEILGEKENKSNHMQAHHECYFQELTIDVDAGMWQSTIFLNKTDAIHLAQKQAKEREMYVRRELKSLEKRLKELEGELI